MDRIIVAHNKYYTMGRYNKITSLSRKTLSVGKIRLLSISTIRLLSYAL
jgi:hypothetical protein